MNLYELNKKLKTPRQRGFRFNQISNLTMKTYSDLSNFYKHYFLKFSIPILHRHLFWLKSRNREYVEPFCNIEHNPFHFACRNWYSFYNPQCWYSIITLIHIRIIIYLFLYLYKEFELVMVLVNVFENITID